jgi:hypothetical protein
MNSLDMLIEKSYSKAQKKIAGDMLLKVAEKYFAEALDDPFGWAQSQALLLQLMLNELLDAAKEATRNV